MSLAQGAWWLLKEVKQLPGPRHICYRRLAFGAADPRRCESPNWLPSKCPVSPKNRLMDQDSSEHPRRWRECWFEPQMFLKPFAGVTRCEDIDVLCMQNTYLTWDNLKCRMRSRLWLCRFASGGTHGAHIGTLQAEHAERIQMKHCLWFCSFLLCWVSRCWRPGGEGSRCARNANCNIKDWHCNIVQAFVDWCRLM